MSNLYFASLGRLVVFTLVTLSFVSPALLKAQDTSSMTGVVTDTTGAALPDATVVLSNALTGISYTQTTNNQGVYRFANVPPNQGYTAVFSHNGFASLRVSAIVLNVGITRTQDAKLAAGNTEVVDVSAANQAVTLNTTDASIGNNMSVQQLDELPVYDRTSGITTLFYQQPGVDSNQGAVTGARTDQTEVTIDGLDTNDIASNALFTIVGNAPIDSVQQFTGTVAGLVPAIGTGSGAQFQLVTKNGTNEFHGNINEYHRDTTTAANTWFNNLDGLPRTPLIRNQFGGNIGGPIKKDKLFFFFNFNDSRIIFSQTGEDIVPLSNLTGANPTLNYINNGAGCSDSSRINTQPSCITTLSVAQVMALDPNHVGFDNSVLSYMATRYPPANDLTQGDGVNTGGYRFTVPTPDILTNYVGRIDYNLTSNNRIFGRFTIDRENAIENLPEFPTDPVTHPFIDRSYGYVVSDVWTIGKNKVNQFYYGDNVSKFSFPDLYNPTGADQYSFASNLSSTILSGPYTDFDGQHRRVPIPVVRDDFNWQLGSHSIVAGGTFKFIKATSNLTNDFNFVDAGLQGSALGGGLDPSLRPSDIYTSSTGTALNDYDNIFAATLGDIGEISTNFDYTNKLAAVPPGTGATRSYRYFETEAYVGDTWKVNPRLTLTYGLRYQIYSVPYETNGEESVEYFNTPSGNTSVQNSTYNAYVRDRLAQSASGNTSTTGLPIYQVELGGKANHGPNLYAMAKKDFAPRIAFSYNPQPGTVFNGGIGIVYDRTVINAINFLQDQISYLFANTINNQFPTSTQPLNSTLSPAAYALSADPRLGPNLSYDQTALNPVPAPLTVPYTPYVDGSGVPYGLAAEETNFIISPNLKDPYSIALNFGVQQDLPWHMVMKLNYSGRLGRRLLADADAGQVLDVPDYTGLSTQSMAAAFAGLTTQLRAGTAITAQPWFEDVLAPGTGAAYGAANPTSGITNNTQLVAALAGQYVVRGDISDSLQTLAADTYYYGYTNFLPTNIGIPSQFGSNTYLTNQGNSNYHALLLTVDKNLSNGLHFEFNYTWSHSIDNTSLSSANNALYNGFGLICDITRPRACRASSDFDVRQEISSNFVYEIPVGRGREFLATAPRWVDEAIGGWAVSAIPIYRTGVAVNPFSYAFLASFENDEPAIFTGNKSDLKSHVNVSNGTVYDFAGGAAGAAKVLSEFRGPIGLEYGQRNLVYGPGAFFLDAGLAKKFAIIQDKVTMTFRADAFNVLNHPAFGAPALNIVTNTSPFGQITSMANEPGNTQQTSRVAQFSLRLEF